MILEPYVWLLALQGTLLSFTLLALGRSFSQQRPVATQIALTVFAMSMVGAMIEVDVVRPSMTARDMLPNIALCGLMLALAAVPSAGRK